MVAIVLDGLAIHSARRKRCGSMSAKMGTSGHRIARPEAGMGPCRREPVILFP